MQFSSPFIENLINLTHYKIWLENNAQFLLTPYLFLSSYPRSGNGWIRMVLAAMVLETKGIDINSVKIIRKMTETGVKYICFTLGDREYDLEDIFPDMYILNSKVDLSYTPDNIKDLNLEIKLIKTHHIIDCSVSKTIFLFREPLNCLTSAALLLNSEEINHDSQKINETMVYLAKFYSQMLEHYLQQKQKYPENCFFLSHQKISGKEASLELAKVIDFIGLEVKEDTIEKVLQKFPFRSGYNKKLAQSVDKSTKEYINDLLKEKYEKAIAMSNEQKLFRNV